MLVVRFKIRVRPDKADEVMVALAAAVEPSRGIDGVISFDIGRDVTDPNAFFAVEVFEDRAALDRQEAQEVVQNVLALLPEAVAAAPEATIFEVSSSAPHGG
jgi:quinol monooxygenase YgiN